MLDKERLECNRARASDPTDFVSINLEFKCTFLSIELGLLSFRHERLLKSLYDPQCFFSTSFLSV